eukprot:6988368-Pyramimonas_sp.AAC.1
MLFSTSPPSSAILEVIRDRSENMLENSLHTPNCSEDFSSENTIFEGPKIRRAISISPFLEDIKRNRHVWHCAS